MKKIEAHYESDSMDKNQLANVLALLLDCRDLQPQFMKMSIPALRKMYEGHMKNLNAYGLAKEQLKDSEAQRKILQARCDSFERDLKKALAK